MNPARRIREVVKHSVDRIKDPFTPEINILEDSNRKAAGKEAWRILVEGSDSSERPQIKPVEEKPWFPDDAA